MSGETVQIVFLSDAEALESVKDYKPVRVDSMILGELEVDLWVFSVNNTPYLVLVRKKTLTS